MAVAARYPNPSPHFMRHLEAKSASIAENHAIAVNLGRKAGWLLKVKGGNVRLRDIGDPRFAKPTPRDFAFPREFFASGQIKEGDEITVADANGNRYAAIARVEQ